MGTLIVLMGGCIAQAQIEPPEMLPAEFIQPVDLKHAGDDRLFVVEKTGRIWIMDKAGVKSIAPFLNITDRVNAGANERGLLGLAFHPDFIKNGHFYVNYTGSGGHTRISRFTLANGEEDLADPSSEVVLMQVNQPFNNHNAGDLAFGPDGYLYIPLGDGGSAGDPGNSSQDPTELLGKMLRIDVDGGFPYGIPSDNPFAGSTDTLPEIWGFGLRNPWRMSFDRFTGDLWIADVGQGNWEEIDLVPAGSSGGHNWGWRCYEGFEPYNLTGCGAKEEYDPPVHVYPNLPTVGCSVTGGYVYRGARHPSLFGKYLFTDFCSGRIWTLSPDGNGGFVHQEVYKGLTQEYVAFGEDNEGELYLVTLGEGRVFRLKAPCALSLVVKPESALCAGECTGSLEVALQGGCPPFQIGWGTSDTLTIHTADTLIKDLCPGAYNLEVVDCNGCMSSMGVSIGEPISPELILAWVGDTLLASPIGFSSYQWFLNDSLVAETGSSFWVPESSGTWQVKGIDVNGCITISNPIGITLSILDGFDFKWSVYPNPFTNRIWVEGRLPDGYWLELFDVWGHSVRSARSSPAFNTSGDWVVEDLPAGIYLLVARNDHGFFPITRLVKSFKGS